MRSSKSRRRSAARGHPSIAPMNAPIACLQSVPSRRGLCLLKLFCPAVVLIVLIVVIGYSASRGFYVNQDARMLKNAYGVYTYKILKEYDHDPQAFTQGLVYAGNDTFYESTGLYGLSSLRKVDLLTGEVLQRYDMENQYFGEGLTLFNHRLLQVAWRVTFGFIYDELTFSLLGKFNHPMKDGWGLATDGKVLYGSDGSSTIYVMDPSTFKEQRKFTVKDDKKEIHLLNELELIGGELWANVWMTDCIVRISPDNGQVLGWILLQNLRSNLLTRGYQNMDVLNGIAWDPDQRRIFVTGKNWPKLYEINVFPSRENFNDRNDIWRRCQA